MFDDPAPGMADLPDVFNAVQLAELEAVSDLRYLGAAGPVYLAGHVRIRGAFVDRAPSATGRTAAVTGAVRQRVLRHARYRPCGL